MWSETLSLFFAIHTQYLLFKPAAAATAWKDLKYHTGNFDFFWGTREGKKKKRQENSSGDCEEDIQ